MGEDLVVDVKAKIEAIEALPVSEQPEAYRELQKQLERILENNEE